MKTIVSCIILAITCSCLSTAEETQHVAPPDKESFSRTVKGNKSVVLLSTKEVGDVGMIKKVQEQYTKKQYPNHRVFFTFGIMSKDDRYVESVACFNDDFEDMKLVHFDMTDVYQHLKQKDEQSKKAIEKLEERYITRK